jgi:hypothetical protein
MDQHWGFTFLLLHEVIGDEVTHSNIPVVPHKAAAEVSKIGNLEERLVVANHRWQSEATGGSKGD